MTALVLVGVGFVNGVEVGPEVDFAGAHLRDHGTDDAVRFDLRLQCCFARADS